MIIGISTVCTAFQAVAIGSRVEMARHQDFLKCVQRAIEAHEASPEKQDRVPGQYFLRLEDTANGHVVGGVGKRTDDPNDYCTRVHRGHVAMFLNRSFEEPVEHVDVVVYTIDAYGKDPDVDADEMKVLLSYEITHVIVAVLAACGPDAPALSPYRFVHNLAGGNNEALAWTADEIRTKAKEILWYENNWITVAD